MAVIWNYTLDVRDIWAGLDGSAFNDSRDQVVRRIEQAAVFWGMTDDDLVSIIDRLEQAGTLGDFDRVWNEFTDWADLHQVRVETS